MKTLQVTRSFESRSSLTAVNKTGKRGPGQARCFLRVTVMEPCATVHTALTWGPNVKRNYFYSAA